MSRLPGPKFQITVEGILSRLTGIGQKKRSQPGRSKERGQAFIELALSLVFLLMLVSVVIDLGWAFYTLIALRDAAEEAAAYGAMCPRQSDNVSQNTDMIREHLRLSASAPLDMSDIDLNNISVVFTNMAGTHLAPTDTPIMGGSVIVTVTIQHDIMTPFLGAIIGRQDYPLTVTISNTVMRSRWMQPCDQ